MKRICSIFENPDVVEAELLQETDIIPLEMHTTSKLTYKTIEWFCEFTFRYTGSNIKPSIQIIQVQTTPCPVPYFWFRWGYQEYKVTIPHYPMSPKELMNIEKSVFVFGGNNDKGVARCKTKLKFLLRGYRIS